MQRMSTGNSRRMNCYCSSTSTELEHCEPELRRGPPPYVTRRGRGPLTLYRTAHAETAGAVCRALELRTGCPRDFVSAAMRPVICINIVYTLYLLTTSLLILSSLHLAPPFLNL